MSKAPGMDNSQEDSQYATDNMVFHRLNEEVDSESAKYPSGLKIALVFWALCLTVFLVALDQTIIATAIPTITSQFHSVEDIGWYGSVFLLTNCSFQLFFGKLYTLFPLKWTFVSAVLVFEAGSAICGASPNSAALIIGRAIAGVGGAGIFSGALIIIAKSVPLSKRPAFTGIIGAVWGIASVIGPLLGGLLQLMYLGAGASTVCHRYSLIFSPGLETDLSLVNLPIGAIAIPCIVLFLSQKPEARLKPKGWATLSQFDPVGTICFVASIICLLIALQWGGTQYSWRDGRIIALLTVFGALMIIWVITQWRGGDNATVPLRVLRQRTVACSTFYIFFASASFVLLIYYLPIWFQAIKGDSPDQSGIHNLPTVLSVVIFAIVSGLGVSIMGYYSPFMIAGSMIMAIGAGLFLTFKVNIPTSMWFGFQVIFGAGAGIGMELANIAVQTVLPEKDVSVGTSLVVFARSLGGAIFVSVGQNIFGNHIVTGMRVQVPQLDPSIVLQSGATDLRRTVTQAVSGPADTIVTQVLEIYNNAVVQTFVVALALACVAILGALGVEWRSVKDKPKEPKSEESPGRVTHP